MRLSNFNITIFILLACCFIAQDGFSVDTGRLYKEVKEKYIRFYSFRADIETSVNISDGMEVKLFGRILLEMPNKWLLSLSSGRGENAKLCYYSVSNGKDVWNLDPKTGAVVKEKSRPAANLGIRFFPSFASYFSIDGKDMKIEKEDMYYVCKLKIIEKGSIFSYVKIYIDAEKTEISKLVFTGSDGKQKMCISFINSKMNANIPRDEFVNKITGKVKQD